jgi:hypothetical protein
MKITAIDTAYDSHNAQAKVEAVEDDKLHRF